MTKAIAALVTRINLSKVVLGALFALLIAIGFDFHTPAWHFRQLYAENVTLHKADSTMSARIAQADSDREAIRTELHKYTRILSVAQCLDRPRRETILMGLNCTQILEEAK